MTMISCADQLAAARARWRSLADQLTDLEAIQRSQMLQRSQMNRDLLDLVQQKLAADAEASARVAAVTRGNPIGIMAAANIAQYLLLSQAGQGEVTTAETTAPTEEETRGGGVSVLALLRTKADELKARIAELERRA